MSAKKIIGIIIITILAVAGAVGYIGYSFTESDATAGDTTITQNIVQEGTIASPTFSGNIEIEQVIYIYNSGVLDIEDITVEIQVFFSGDITTSEVEVGQGTNDLGTAPAGENSSKTLTITLTNEIARLAVEDGTFRIVVDITLSIQYADFYPIEIPTQETNEPWSAPYSNLA